MMPSSLEIMLVVQVHSFILHSFFKSLLSTSDVPGTASVTLPYFYGVNEANYIDPISQLWKGGNERRKDLICEEATKAKLKSASWISCPVLVWFGLAQSSGSPAGEQRLPVWGTVGNVCVHLRLSQGGEGRTTASGGQKPGILLSILQRTGHPVARNDWDQNVNSAAVQKPWFRRSIWKFQLIIQNLFTLSG